MFAPAASLHVDPNQRKRLKHLAGSGKTPQKVALRARIALLAGEGLANHAIAAQLNVSRPTVILWRQRFSVRGVDGLMKDAPRPGRRKAISAEIQALPFRMRESATRMIPKCRAAVVTDTLPK